MAIDDNTSYELTGAQVKDLANKIKAKAADNTFVGATSAAPGSKGLVPQPQAGDDTKLLKGDGSWGAVTSANIGWSTFANAYAHASRNTAVQYPTSFGNFLTVTVPQTGTYRIESMVHAATNELAQTWYARTRITVNGTVPATFDPYAETLIAGSTDYYACAVISNNGVLSLTQGDVVALQAQTTKNNSRCLLQYADLFIQRIS